MSKLKSNKVNAYINNAQKVIAGNSVIVEAGNAIRINSGLGFLAGIGQRIDGVSITTKTFSPTNATIEREEILYRPNNGDEDMTYNVPVVNGTLTQSDIGRYYQMDGSQNLDASTGSPTTGVYRVKNVHGNGNIAEISLTKQGT